MKSRSGYTVIRIDVKLHLPDRMAPDQTSRVMGNKFDIRDGNGMEMLNRFNIF